MVDRKWWHDKIAYEIYPKSFKDDNNDGIGDIKGIISKLDYLKDLGVDIIWITPFFKSPMKDNGYDVSDYLDINEMFGSIEDMEQLIDECNKRNMYIMMDVVANHTSNKHKWFIESKKSKDNPYRDYYIWKDEKLFDLQSCFGGSAWEYDENTKQYYFHEFAKEQPDLNWENPKVMEEIASNINFWLDKGIKGIRFDVIHLIGKEIDKNILAYGPTLHEKVKKLNELSFGKYDIITVGEAWGNIDTALDFTLPSRNELNMVFQFECTSATCDYSRYGKFTPKPIDMEFIKHTLIKYQRELNDKSWNALMVENHDLGRCINKFGSLKYYDKSAKEIAIMNFLLKGTPYLYQGQELGMTNIKIDNVDDYDDVEVKGYYNDLVKTGILSNDEFLKACNEEARDNNRTPMQWDDSINAGFNKGAKPWFLINPNYKEINAKKEINSKDSIYSFYKKLISLRKSNEYKDTFVYGSFNAINENQKNVFIYTRNDTNKNICVVCNMNDGIENVSLPMTLKKLLLANYDKDYSSTNEFTLMPYEAFVFEY